MKLSKPGALYPVRVCTVIGDQAAFHSRGGQGSAPASAGGRCSCAATGGRSRGLWGRARRLQNCEHPPGCLTRRHRPPHTPRAALTKLPRDPAAPGAVLCLNATGTVRVQDCHAGICTATVPDSYHAAHVGMARQDSTLSGASGPKRRALMPDSVQSRAGASGSRSAPGLSALRAVAVRRMSAILSCRPSWAAPPPNFSLTTSKLATYARH